MFSGGNFSVGLVVVIVSDTDGHRFESQSPF